MPEGPEVEVVVRTLEHQIKNLCIKDIRIVYENVVQSDSLPVEKIKGQTFLRFDRIGKYLIFTLSDDQLVFHLRMEGKFYIYDELPTDLKHIHVIFTLDNGRKLCYHDTRKFGRMVLYPKEKDLYNLPALQHVGYDFMDARATPDYFYQSIHTSKRSLKAALLDQSIMAGIGNIYADEICFACKLDPRSRCTRISKKDCEAILFHTRRILKGAIRFGGTTIRDYTSSLGVTGRFQLRLKVHTRQGKSCIRCGHVIDKVKVSQRGTYLCRNCQKRK